MAAGDMPMFSASNYASTAYGGIGVGGFDWSPSSQAHAANLISQLKEEMPKKSIGRKKAVTFDDDDDDTDGYPPKQTNMETQVTAPARRLVQVIIVDPNENIPLDQCLLYKGDPKLTDATDQELFFELDIKQLLSAHNENRIKAVDKKVKDRTEYLEAAKVRDLKMVVVNIATF
jgi:hypothetical protein